MKPLFSIIIPSFNVAQYVEKAVDSCLNQNGISSDEIEIIIINDGSTDSTLQILNKYQGYNNVIIVDQDNQGLSASRNRGIELSSGDYLLFLDADDWFLDNALSVLKSNIGEDDIILFPMIYYYNENTIIRNAIGNLSTRQYTADDLLKGTIAISEFRVFPAPSKCYKRNFIINNNLRFVTGILHEDGPFFLDVISKAHSILYINEFIYCYRQERENSITTSKRTWRNAESIFIGNKHVFNTYGYSNKDVSYYYIATITMQLLMTYKSKDDELKVLKYISKLSTRWFLLKSLFNARTPFRPALICILTILSPRATKSLHKMIAKIK